MNKQTLQALIILILLTSFCYAYKPDGVFTLINNIDDGGSADGLWYDGTYVYLANGAAGLYVYNFDGTTLTLITSIDDGIGNAYSVWGDGTYIYLADGTDGIFAYDFNGDTLTLRGSVFDGVGTAFSLWADINYVYVANGSTGLFAYDFNGDTFTQVGNQAASWRTYRVYGDGTYIYTSDQDAVSGLTAYDFNGDTFTLKGNTLTSPAPNSIWSDGNYIYTGDDSTARIYAFDFNGDTFNQVGEYADLAWSSFGGIFGNKGYVYVTEIFTGIYAFDFNGDTFLQKGFNATGLTSGFIYGDSNYIFMDKAADGLYAYYFDEDTIVYTLTFDVQDSVTLAPLTNITVDWNEDAYDLAGQNSPFTQDINEGTYLTSFTLTGYDGNFNYPITADSNQNITIYIDETIIIPPLLSAPTCGILNVTPIAVTALLIFVIMGSLVIARQELDSTIIIMLCSLAVASMIAIVILSQFLGRVCF